MPIYDLNLILNPSLDPTQLASEKDAITGALERHGAAVQSSEEWGNRRLAYELQKEREGYYLSYLVEIPGNQVGSLEKELLIRDHVRRVVTIKQNPRPAKA